MTILKTLAGQNPDGTPHYNYTIEGEDAVVVMTGPAAGLVKTADGTEYIVDEPVIEVASQAHAEEVAHAIGEQHMRRGTFGPEWEFQPDPDVAARFEAATPDPSTTGA